MKNWEASKNDLVDRSRRSFVLPLVAAVLIAAMGCVPSFDEARAERVIQVGAVKRTTTMKIYIGKSEAHRPWRRLAAAPACEAAW